MSKIISVSSGKGGTGKSTVSVFTAQSLAAKGKRVLAIELDAGFRCLDVAFGISQDVLFDLGDVLSGRCSISDACKPCPFCNKVSVICAPLSYEEDIIRNLLNIPSATEDFDYVILDCPAGINEIVEMALKISDITLVIATADPSSVRAAKKMSSVAFDYKVPEIRLVIERCPQNPKLLKPYNYLDEIIDSCETQLIGVIWDDPKTRYSMDTGTALSENCPNKKMFSDIAGRILGERIYLGIK